ncbi:hypothetical protein JHD50_05675 [Sulfurimonas sp. MAG313]|nr:hypothetical protein [Sulfurimonas sp. MAG313]MDF1880797.1 hypothetical protein [Sulfurimonas sp. MAG313]
MILLKKLFWMCLLASSLNAFNTQSIPIHGFMDMGSAYTDEDGKVNFTTGSLDLYLTKDISERMNVLIELLFETDGSAFITDLERLQISYAYNEYITATFGKFHTPYGYWNTAFHHGAQIQTSILRPKFIAFEDEGGVLPSHGVGMAFNGYLEDISYTFYITGGSSISLNEDNNSSSSTGGNLSTNNGQGQDGTKLYGLNLAYEFEELTLGLHSFYQDVSIFLGRETSVFMYGGYLLYETDSIELIAETYFYDNKNIKGGILDKRLYSNTTFAQIAYNINDYTPYLRLETASYNDADLYFHSQLDTAGGSYDRLALGLRYELNDDASLKVAYLHTNESISKDHSSVLTQLAIRF